MGRSLVSSEVARRTKGRNSAMPPVCQKCSRTDRWRSFTREVGLLTVQPHALRVVADARPRRAPSRSEACGAGPAAAPVAACVLAREQPGATSSRSRLPLPPTIRTDRQKPPEAQDKRLPHLVGTRVTQRCRFATCPPNLKRAWRVPVRIPTEELRACSFS